MWLYNQYVNLPRFSKTAKNHKTWSKFAEWENQEQHQETFIYLANLYTNQFKWNNLPSTCNEIALERTLFFYGVAIFFKDREPYKKDSYTDIADTDRAAAYWHTPVMLTEGVNLYYEHIHRKAYSYNFEKTFRIDNSVLIRDNVAMFPPYITTMIYAQKLTDAARSIDVLTDQMKYPAIVEGDETDLLSIERLFDRIRRNESAILTVPGWIDGKIKTTPLGSTGQGQNLAALWDHYNALMNQYLTRRGIDNANTDKKERLVVAETRANNELVQRSADVMLDSRKRACEEINKMYGLNISVEWRHPPEEGEVMSLGPDQGANTVQTERD